MGAMKIGRTGDVVEGLQQLLIKTIVGEVPPLWQATLRFVPETATEDGALRDGALD